MSHEIMKRSALSPQEGLLFSSGLEEPLPEEMQLKASITWACSLGRTRISLTHVLIHIAKGRRRHLKWDLSKLPTGRE